MKRAHSAGPSFVYFAQDDVTGLIKIGRSRNVTRRIAHLRWETKHPIRLLISTPGGSDAETALHDQFTSHRVHGEWFRSSPGMVAVIAVISRIALDPLTYPLMVRLRQIQHSGDDYWGEWATLLDEQPETKAS